MPEPTLVEQPQVAAEAMLGKERSARARKTPEQEMAERIRSELAKDVSPRQVAEGMSPHPPPTEARFKHVNNENTGSRRKGGDGEDAGEKIYDAGSSSEKFKKNADAHAGLAQQLLSLKYEDITDTADFAGTGMTTKEYLTKQFMDAAYSWPEGRAVLEAYGTGPAADAARSAKIEELFLRNPQMLKKLGTRFGEIYNGDKAILNDIVSEAQDEFERAEKVFTAKEEALGSLKDRLQKIEEGEKRFLPGTMDYDALIRLRGESVNWDGQLRTKKDELEKLDRDVKNAYQKVEVRTPTESQVTDPNNPNKILTNKQTVASIDTGIATQIQQAEQRMDRLRSEIATIELQQGKLKGFEDEVNRLSKERQELKSAETPLVEDAAKAELDLKNARRKLDVARASRLADEERFANDVEGMFKDAGMKFMKEEAQRYEAAQAKIAEKEAESATDTDEKNIMNAMREEWRVDVKKGRRTVSKPNKENASQDYDRLLSEGSAESFVKSFMQKSLDEVRKKYGIGSVQEQEEQRRLDERFKDTQFMKKMEGMVSQRLIKTHLESGGKIRAEDASVLAESDWGEQALDGAIKDNKDAAALLDKLKQENAYAGTKTDFIKELVKNPGKYKTRGLTAAGLLALLFGAPFLIAGAGILAGGYSAAASAVS